MKQKQLKNMLVATVALLITLLAMPQTAQAVENYGFHVGGVYVTKYNRDNITGSNIKPYNGATDSKVWYEPISNTLYFRNTRVDRSGGSKRCIENESNDGLNIVFIGDNYLYSKNSEAIRLKHNTNIYGGKADSKPYIYAYSDEYEGIYVEIGSKVRISNLYIVTSSLKNHAILGDHYEKLELDNVDIYCPGTGDNKAVVANFDYLTLKNSHIYTSPEAKKTYGIRIDSYYLLRYLYIGGTSSIRTSYPAIHTNGVAVIIGLDSDGTSKLEATSSNDCAIYADWKKDAGKIQDGKLDIKNININLKGKSSGIRGNRYDNKHDLPSVYLKNVSGIIEATEPGAGLITKLKRFELTDCNIAEPYGAYFSSDKHALCDINGYTIIDRVRMENKWSAGVEGVKTDQPAAVSEIYSADGRRQSQMRCGLNIVRMTDGTTKKVIVK